MLQLFARRGKDSRQPTPQPLPDYENAQNAGFALSEIPTYGIAEITRRAAAGIPRYMDILSALNFGTETGLFSQSSIDWLDQRHTAQSVVDSLFRVSENGPGPSEYLQKGLDMGLYSPEHIKAHEKLYWASLELKVPEYVVSEGLASVAQNSEYWLEKFRQFGTAEGVLAAAQRLHTTKSAISALDDLRWERAPYDELAGRIELGLANSLYTPEIVTLRRENTLVLLSSNLISGVLYSGLGRVQGTPAHKYALENGILTEANIAAAELLYQHNTLAGLARA